MRILLRSGLTFPQFSKLAKATYVAVASDEFGIRGRTTNVSRVALLTGLSRRDVRRQRELLQELGTPGADKASNIARVLHGWYTDAQFLDDGEPAVLQLNGERSFDSLYQQYGGGDVPCSTALKELLNSGSVEQLDGGRVRALSRTFVPVRSNPVAVERAGEVLADLGNTVAENLYSDSDLTLFEGRATSRRIPDEQLFEFREFLEAEGQRFLERVDDWLTARENPAHRSDVRLGVGLYQIQVAQDKPDNNDRGPDDEN